jgi:osmotically inducible lipoprotein OsmB
MKITSSIVTKSLVISVLFLSACADMNSSQQRTLSGAGIGAGVGAAGAAVTGRNPIGGAVIGGALGAGGGYLYDKNKKK